MKGRKQKSARHKSRRWLLREDREGDDVGGGGKERKEKVEKGERSHHLMDAA